MGKLRTFTFTALLLLPALLPGRTARAFSTVHRSLTLPGSTGEFQVGLGVGHADEGADDATGLGLNLAFAYGLTSNVELGVRTGIRFGHDGRLTRADEYGRTFETEQYGTVGDEIANPEVSLRFTLARGIVDLGLDTRVYLPTEDGSRVGFMVGLPLAVHLGGVARLDTGLYVPVIFYDPTQSYISIPVHLWFQVDNRICLGPLTGLRIHNPGGDRQVPLGLGLGYSLSGSAELRTWLLFPDISADHGARTFGVGLGLALRF